MYVPNILSILRIILSVLLIPFMSIPFGFITIYILAGISDVLDGYIARKFGYESDLGAKLDSIADMVFFCILVFIFFRRYISVVETNYQFIAIIAAIRFFNMFMTKLKYKKVVYIHTLGNKISGIALYVMPLILLFTKSSILVRLILTIVAIAAIEELFITIKYSEPNLNRKSIFIE